jgi:integrase
LEELDRVLEAIPAPPVVPDVWGPVVRAVMLIAAITGLRQSELLGLRWRHVDWVAQRIRFRRAYVRGEHSGEGKSSLTAASPRWRTGWASFNTN